MSVHEFPKKVCRWCGEEHPEEHCPRVSAREFFGNGSLHRVEFHGDPMIEFEFDDDPEAG